ncbi:ATP:cob(I)alamin adenosyltransferase [Natronomonas pharaonis DSM 2160]|uniref:ATP:cob(I)alamin adenosyltransferase n=1 Tax=Natronomonas pharaonis (strain ATCC 35678 / DSM 2160 / CIP 103997 / JCM 8858 / NBRC 14720 / NCIMB 2260 / Gabara) TaxID=348780 RepID=A0A1U7EWY4_NATPD|nr:cob(I)yrinic acid a,c-diamide adenosyltransferase [Natronomonas pharaonis]CAI49595.1 ATP:cob(I)alamin adenosyltransferase [Natronomonas pharaonis DSM 2160]
MKIYTGRGDEGMTDLRDMSRVSKTSARIEAYGTVDEVNSLVGMVRPSGHDDVDEKLAAVQNHLHIIQADFANPDADDPDAPHIEADHVERLESWMDDFDDELDPLESFILPGGSDTGAKLHHARSVCRRAERRAVALASDEPVNDAAVAYLNRLSDALFVWARVVNKRDGVREESPSY